MLSNDVNDLSALLACASIDHIANILGQMDTACHSSIGPLLFT